MSASYRKYLKRHPTMQKLSLLLNLLGILAYLTLGAIMFKLAEEDNEIRERAELQETENNLKSRWNLTEEAYNSISTVVLKFEMYKNGRQWSFTGAFYFVITVVTTIGYGHAVPQTKIGKFLCTIYAIIGIPLWLYTAQMMGERLNKSSASILKEISRRTGYISRQIEKRHLIFFGAILLLMTAILGIVVFRTFEKWSYLESAYYCVMTLSTIGFGDYVSLQGHGVMQGGELYVAFNFVYIFLGLTVSGAFLNLLVLRSCPQNAGIYDKDCCRNVEDDALSSQEEDDITDCEDGSSPQADITKSQFYEKAVHQNKEDDYNRSKGNVLLRVLRASVNLIKTTWSSVASCCQCRKYDVSVQINRNISSSPLNSVKCIRGKLNHLATFKCDSNQQDIEMAVDYSDLPSRIERRIDSSGDFSLVKCESTSTFVSCLSDDDSSVTTDGSREAEIVNSDRGEDCLEQSNEIGKEIIEHDQCLTDSDDENGVTMRIDREMNSGESPNSLTLPLRSLLVPQASSSSQKKTSGNSPRKYVSSRRRSGASPPLVLDLDIVQVRESFRMIDADLESPFVAPSTPRINVNNEPDRGFFEKQLPVKACRSLSPSFTSMKYVRASSEQFSGNSSETTRHKESSGERDQTETVRDEEFLLSTNRERKTITSPLHFLSRNIMKRERALSDCTCPVTTPSGQVCTSSKKKAHSRFRCRNHSSAESDPEAGRSQR